MALRFKSEFLSFKGVEYAVEVHDADHSGAVTTFILGADGFTQSWSGENKERHNSILSTSISFTFLVQNATHAAFITDLATSREGRFTVLVTKGSTPVRDWAGVILADTARLADAPYPYPFDVKATDGISALKDVPYNNAGAAYTGDEKMLVHISNCLKKIPAVSVHYQSGIFLRTAVDWRDTAHAAGATDDPIYKTSVSHGIWYDFDNDGNTDYLSCYEVLHQICQIFGGRIVQQSGAFWIEQISIRDTDAGFNVFTYNYSVVQQGTETNSGWNLLNQTASGAKMRGMTYDWFPPLNKVEITQKTYNRRNFLLTAFDKNTSTYTHWQPLKNPNSKAVLRLTGTLALTLKNIAHTTGAAMVIVFNIKIKVNTKSVERPISFTSGNYQFGLAQWVNDSLTVFVKHVVVFSIPPEVGETATGNFGLDFTTPVIPTEGNVSFDFDFLEYRRLQTGAILPESNFEINFSLKNQWLEVYTNGLPDSNEDELFHTSYNSESGNTKKLALSTLLGEGTDSNTLGRLLVNTGSGLVDATAWGAGTNPRNKRIVSLLAETILAGQLKPAMRMYGMAFGDFEWWKTWKTNSDGKKWLLAGGSYNTNLHQMSGEWFEVKYNTGFNSVTPVKKKLKGVVVPDPNTFGVSGNGGIKNDSEKTAGPGAILGAIAGNTTALLAPTGSTSMLTMAEAMADGAYHEGDIITVVNPGTGAFQTLTVTADAQEGDTELSVSGTLSTDYPVGTYIIKNPATYTQQSSGSSGWSGIRPKTTVTAATASVDIPAERLVTTVVLVSTSSGTAKIGTSAGAGDLADELGFAASTPLRVDVQYFFNAAGTLHFTGLAGTTTIYIYAV